MKRRGFLGAASAGFGAALWPLWLREAFADEPVCEGKQGKEGESPLARIAMVAAAYRAASEAKRPLLVLVIPDDGMEKWARGQAFGELLNHGDDKQLAPLAKADVVCATMTELKKIVPTAGVGEPLMVLVSTDRAPAAARQLDAKLPEYGSPHDASERVNEDEVAKKRIAVMAGLLRRALGEADKQAQALAADVRAKLTKRPPRGARWGRSYGCGTEIEGEVEQMAIGCGMGHIPAKSQRFLYFFAKRTF